MKTLFELNAEALKHGYEQICQGIVVRGVKGKVLAMPETPTCKQNWKIHIRMGVGTAHAGAIKNHGPAKQCLALFLRASKGL